MNDMTVSIRQRERQTELSVADLHIAIYEEEIRLALEDSALRLTPYEAARYMRKKTKR